MNRSFLAKIKFCKEVTFSHPVSFTNLLTSPDEIFTLYALFGIFDGVGWYTGLTCSLEQGMF